MCLGLYYIYKIKRRAQLGEEKLAEEREIATTTEATIKNPKITTAIYFHHHLLLPSSLASLSTATPAISSPILILTNCGKYNYIYLSFYFLLKQGKLGLCILYLLCVYESYSVCSSVVLYFFIYCIDFSYFQVNTG